MNKIDFIIMIGLKTLKEIIHGRKNISKILPVRLNHTDLVWFNRNKTSYPVWILEIINKS
jgi:hypothetical protein